MNAIIVLVWELMYSKYTNGSKTAVKDVIGFL
jgi:hypothetical protein